jgi:hypothetical protein
MQTHSIASSTMGDQSASPNPIPLWSGIGEPHQMSSESSNPFEDLVGVSVDEFLAQPTTAANAAGAACHSAPPPPADAELANAMLIFLWSQQHVNKALQ